MTQNIIKLFMGDPSGDGHSFVSDVYITSNLDASEIQNAFDKGADAIGLNITECCEDYEDNYLDAYQLDKLDACGFDLGKIWEYKYCKSQNKNQSKYSLSCEEFAEIFIFTVKKGNPNFEYEYLDYKSIDIGGYGLFR